MWYIHYWRNPDGSVSGFVDRDTWVGTSPHGGSESIKGPYSSEEEARRILRGMNGR